MGALTLIDIHPFLDNNKGAKLTVITTNWIRILSVAVFSVSFALGMALVTWYEIAEVTNDTPLATIIAIIIVGQAVAVVSAGLAAVVEGGAYIVVIAHRMVQQGIEKGKEEGRQEGISEGIVIGENKGRTEAYEDVEEQLDAYFKRMDEAREKGEDFNEPRPRFGRNGR